MPELIELMRRASTIYYEAERALHLNDQATFKRKLAEAKQLLEGIKS